MPKNILQDVLPRNGKSIRDIPLPHRKNASIAESENDDPKFGHPHNLHHKPRNEVVDDSLRHVEPREQVIDLDEGTNKHRWLIWSIVAGSALALIIVLGTIFSGATITITPKSQSVLVDFDVIAKPTAIVNGLSYKPLILTKEKELSVTADSEKVVESPAYGNIIVYNNYSTSQQRLIKNTRFETPDGLIFKIKDSITIPGKHQSGGKTIPGSLEVTVYAESPSEEYNIGLTDFTIPGLKSNSERYTTIYARSKTAMIGGKNGMAKVVSDEMALQTRAKLQEQLKQELLSTAEKQVPENYIFYPDAFMIDYKSLPESQSGNSVVFREQATLKVVLIDRTSLAKTIADKTLSNFDQSAIDVPDSNKLILTLRNRENYSGSTVGPITVGLKGSATIVWQFDSEKLKKDLIGKDKNNLDSIIGRYVGIQKADVVIRPFWTSIFPDDLNKIKVKTLDPVS